MGQERVGDLACGLAEYRLIWKVYGRGAKLVLRGAWVQRLGWGGGERGLARWYRIWERTMSVFDFV